MLKSFPKIFLILFLSTFIIQLFCVILLLALPLPGQAASNINFTPQVTGLNYNFNNSDTSTGNIANYIKAIYQYAIGIVGILAAIVLMVGGVLWIIAGGNATQVGEAKARIGAALTGLVLALTSYLILYTVNPALVNLKTTNVPGVNNTNTNTSSSTTQTNCCAFTKGMYLTCNDTSTASEATCKTAITNEGGTFLNYVANGKCSSKAGEGCIAK
ncbi:MAG: hypothetical protein PHS62_02400 [Patescibacteria group bacterium]|nr:hypothetical protein [Patescibacteria group bacterium]